MIVTARVVVKVTVGDMTVKGNAVYQLMALSLVHGTVWLASLQCFGCQLDSRKVVVSLA